MATDVVRLLAQELKWHRYDTMSQDSGLQCVCGSDSRFTRGIDGDESYDPPWENFDMHVAQVIVGKLRYLTKMALEESA